MKSNSDESIELPQHDSQSEDIAATIELLWRNKLKIFLSTSVFGLLSLIGSMLLPSVYSSSVLLAPANQSSSALSGLLEQYGGLASVAGISLPGSDDDSQINLAIEIMKSRAFHSQFVEKNDMAPLIMAVREWDPQKKEIKFNENYYNSKEKKWTRKAKPPYGVVPSDEEIHKELKKRISITSDKKTGFIRVTFMHESPVFASRFLGLLVSEVNQKLRNQAITESKKSIEFLNEQINLSAFADLNSLFFGLIEKQTEKIMLASARPEYVFQIIDPPYVAKKPVSPNRFIIVVMALLLGFMMSSIYLILVEGKSRE